MCREFLERGAHADYIDVADARHMVAGDSNDRGFPMRCWISSGKLDAR